MEEIIKELEEIGAELYSKYGTDCYTTRCRLHDAREKLKALIIGGVGSSKKRIKRKNGKIKEIVLRALYRSDDFNIKRYPDGSIKSIDEDAIMEFVKYENS